MRFSRTWMIFTVAGIAACGVKTQPGDEAPTNSPSPGIQISSLTPANGPLTGGQVVQVNGVDLDDGTGGISIVFGSEPATIQTITNTTVEVVTPPGAAEGPVNVQATNAFGSYTLQDGFTYGQGSGQSYGAISILSLYDVINPAQFSNGPQDFVDAFAAFVDPTTESLLSALPSVNTCEFNPSAPAASSFTSLDAGSAIEFTLGGSIVTLPKVINGNDISYYPPQVIADPSLFTASGSYDEESNGGSTLDAFSANAAIITPTDFAVTQPDIGAGTDVSNYSQLDVAAGTEFMWAGGTGGDAFFILISGYDTLAGNYTNQDIVCHASDTGTFMVPASATQNLTSGDSAIIYVARRVENEWLLQPNNSVGESLGLIYKIGVMTLIN